ncbi:MAG TPA: type II toxin-antitoxin system VapC family toxin [Urbifossiella sp.]|nr:type II toxin-antitoxin system VapC family toxin [Urbifossiella sp.]
MAVHLDTSILGRLANSADLAHAIAQTAVARLHQRGDVLHVTAQNLIEFRNFATRPKAQNGLGLPPAAAAGLSTRYQAAFSLLEETPAIFPAWRALVDSLGVEGKPVHDARLVAVCHVHAVSQVLTFNVGHFTRFAGFGPGIVVLDPVTL